VAASSIAVPVELVGTLAMYMVARSHVGTAKHDGRWYDGLKQVTVTDTTLRTRPERFPWAWTLPAAAITVGTAIIGAVRYPHLPDRLVTHFDGGGHPTSYTDKGFAPAFGLVGVQIGTVVLLTLLSWLTFRSKANLDAQDPHASERHRRFVTAMARCLLGLAATVNLTMFFLSLAVWKLVGSTGFFPVLLIGPLVVGTGAIVVVSLRIGQGGSRLRFDDEADDAEAGAEAGTGPAEKAVNRDDDRFWKLGMVYFNRDDPAVWVQKRFGVGWTINFARPVAVGVFAVFILALALIPALLH